MIARALLEKCITGKKTERKYLCEQEFALFAMYYFAEYFTYAIPGFQWLMYKMLNEFVRGRFKFLLWIMFRESAKTTIAKIYVIYCIVYRKKRFINWDAYDKGNAEAALFDIATWLQTNKRINADFGQLFYESNQRDATRYATMKRISEFVTVNRVKVKAYSTQESTRGRIYDRWRPDLYVLEDFETSKTIKSVPITAKIVEHIDELKSGLSPDGQVLYLCNYISDSGSVAMLMAEAKENPISYRVQMVSVENQETGQIAWPDKYVRTAQEALEINKDRPRKEWVVSLEQLRKDLNANGRKVFEAEMMNDPESADEPFFDRARVNQDIINATKHKPIKNIGGLSVWEEYRARNRYAFGGDTAKGVGRDSCASVGMRFPVIDTEKSAVIATYSSSTIPPDLFGDEMSAHGNLFGQCLLAPELNNTGYATLTRMKAIYPQHRIYRRVEKDQAGNRVTKGMGWEARPGAVESIYFNFRTAYDAGEIVIYCPALLGEMRLFTLRDLQNATKRGEADVGSGVVTKHFDLLRAACIAWEMKSHATAAPQKKGYKQSPVQSRSEYQG